MNQDNLKRIKEKLDFFYAEKIHTHIQKFDKEFLNGFLDSKLREGVWLFKEDKLGNVYLFEKDIYEVEEFKEKRGVEE